MSRMEERGARARALEFLCFCLLPGVAVAQTAPTVAPPAKPAAMPAAPSSMSPAALQTPAAPAEPEMPPLPSMEGQQGDVVSHTAVSPPSRKKHESVVDKGERKAGPKHVPAKATPAKTETKTRGASKKAAGTPTHKAAAKAGRGGRKRR